MPSSSSAASSAAASPSRRRMSRRSSAAAAAAAAAAVASVTPTAPRSRQAEETPMTGPVLASRKRKGNDASPDAIPASSLTSAFAAAAAAPSSPTKTASSDSVNRIRIFARVLPDDSGSDGDDAMLSVLSTTHLAVAHVAAAAPRTAPSSPAASPSAPPAPSSRRVSGRSAARRSSWRRSDVNAAAATDRDVSATRRTYGFQTVFYRQPQLSTTIFNTALRRSVDQLLDEPGCAHMLFCHGAVRSAPTHPTLEGCPSIADGPGLVEQTLRHLFQRVGHNLYRARPVEAWRWDDILLGAPHSMPAAAVDPAAAADPDALPPPTPKTQWAANQRVAAENDRRESRQILLDSDDDLDVDDDALSEFDDVDADVPAHVQSALTRRRVAQELHLGGTQSAILMSYVEVGADACATLRDLFVPSETSPALSAADAVAAQAAPLQVHADQRGFRYIRGLHHLQVFSVAEALRALQLARQRRSWASADADAEMSDALPATSTPASHTVLTIKVVHISAPQTLRRTNDGSLFEDDPFRMTGPEAFETSVSQLALVHLGTDPPSSDPATPVAEPQTGATGVFGQVLHRLLAQARHHDDDHAAGRRGPQAKRQRIPYRDSPLTELLIPYFEQGHITGILHFDTSAWPSPPSPLSPSLSVLHLADLVCASEATPASGAPVSTVTKAVPSSAAPVSSEPPLPHPRTDARNVRDAHRPDDHRGNHRHVASRDTPSQPAQVPDHAALVAQVAALQAQVATLATERDAYRRSWEQACDDAAQAEAALVAEWSDRVRFKVDACRAMYEGRLARLERDYADLTEQKLAIAMDAMSLERNDRVHALELQNRRQAERIHQLQEQLRARGGGLSPVQLTALETTAVDTAVAARPLTLTPVSADAGLPPKAAGPTAPTEPAVSNVTLQTTAGFKAARKRRLKGSHARGATATTHPDMEIITTPERPGGVPRSSLYRSSIASYTGRPSEVYTPLIASLAMEQGPSNPLEAILTGELQRAMPRATHEAAKPRAIDDIVYDPVDVREIDLPDLLRRIGLLDQRLTYYKTECERLRGDSVRVRESVDDVEQDMAQFMTYLHTESDATNTTLRQMAERRIQDQQDLKRRKALRRASDSAEMAQLKQELEQLNASIAQYQSQTQALSGVQQQKAKHETALARVAQQFQHQASAHVRHMNALAAEFEHLKTAGHVQLEQARMQVDQHAGEQAATFVTRYQQQLGADNARAQEALRLVVRQNEAMEAEKQQLQSKLVLLQQEHHVLARWEQQAARSASASRPPHRPFSSSAEGDGLRPQRLSAPASATATATTARHALAPSPPLSASRPRPRASHALLVQMMSQLAQPLERVTVMPRSSGDVAAPPFSLYAGAASRSRLVRSKPR
ncbi:hypothetical protein CXG81DRAFT_27670 [Caulochytrium protostelioides]|uniref:Kinesin motor domain-containing protein n=1 Tax=Caulochytrium protostelioides TaxID=1555241 RepID=A0A4P9X3H0_9FUNG|nr:hypothetical protein CXG81DRAFT_27670 [Caulochytrium protostelioides]|eukprot:RKO99575.1 hypothetical protein CXG81DRAFT_27670 [Caulochytrium protostelioides]